VRDARPTEILLKLPASHGGTSDVLVIALDQSANGSREVNRITGLREETGIANDPWLVASGRADDG